MNINLTTPINNLSYGIVGTHILYNLVQQGHKVSFFPLGQPVTHKRFEETVRNAYNNQQFFDYNAPSIRIWHQFSMAEQVGKGMRVGYTFFELDSFNKLERHHLKSLDKIAVSCQWAKEIVEKEVPDSSVGVVPLGVDRQVFHENIGFAKSTNTTFLIISKWELRKSHDILIECFCDAFEKEDEVELWLMPDNPFYSKEETAQWESLYKTSKLGSKVQIIHRVETDEEVAKIMSCCDCGVYPSKAEAWNLPALETLSCGKHLIITNYSGHTEFCNPDNSFLIDISKLETAYDGKFFMGDGGQWAEFGEEQKETLIQHMRTVHKLKQSGELKLNEAGIQTAKEFSWQNSAQKLVEIIS